MEIRIIPLAGLPAIRPRDDLARWIGDAIDAAGCGLLTDDVVVVCQKVVSKAEGRIVSLSEIRPSDKARAFADEYEKDAALIELAMAEATEILRMENGHLITAIGAGWICANSGIDRSNQNAEGEVTLLPLDADHSAAELRTRLIERFGGKPAVVISDTFGRPWRLGQLDVAIGAAGFAVVDDHTGRRDWTGRVLEHTAIAVADQIAAAAGLAVAKDEGRPVVIVRGYRAPAPLAGSERAADIIRPRRDDLFR